MSEDPKLSALRLPVDLHTKIVAAAVENGRSRHAEMLHRLESTFNTPEAALAKAQLDRLEAKLDAMNPERLVISSSVTDDDHYALLRRFESAGWKGTRSPTGRLSESQPELQDLPFVTGLSSLTATLRPLNYGGFYNGGFCGFPEGELPKILERGEPVIDLSKYEQFEGRIIRWIDNVGSRPQELKPNDEIEIMTRPHGHTEKILVGDVHPASWVSHGSKLPHLWKWRPTTVTVNVVNTAGPAE